LEEALKAEIQEKQPVSAEYLEIQKQLLKKVEGFKNNYSCLLFLEDHLQAWDLKNCKGIQEAEHDCLLEGMACKVRVRLLCGCRGVLLQCQLVAGIKKIQDFIVPSLLENEPLACSKFLKDTYHTCANSN